MPYGILRRQYAIGFNIQDQLIQVRTLFYPGVFYSVANTTNRAKGSIQDDASDRMLATIIGQGTNIARNITPSFFDLDLHFQFAFIGQAGNHVIRINDLYIMRQLNITSAHLTLTFLV